MSITADQRTELDQLRFFIDGQWVTPQGTETQQAREAATGEHLGTAAMGSEADMDLAVRAARRALDEGPWGRTTPAERSEIMHRFADALDKRADATSTLVSRENGTPIAVSQAFNGAAPAGMLRTYADIATSLQWETVRPSKLGSTIMRREPVGVVGAIAPWNYPQVLAMIKIAPALAAGCTVVLKPSPETALDAYVMGEAAIEAGVPAGVLNIVLAGREVGMSLVSHPLVDKIAFTGSTAAGRIIGAECGRQIKRCSLELGGKSAAIFCEDGDVSTFLGGLDTAMFKNNSQTCTTQSRVIVHRSRYAEVVDALAAHADSFVVGDPLDPATTCGPMASEHHLARVMGYVEQGRRDARLVTGGNRPDGLDRGWFVRPTIFADVDNRHPIAREEIFGPVIVSMPFGTEDEAIALANDSDYGLGGSVWTADEDHGLDIARRVRTGTIGVNYYSLDSGAPFGGMKASGIGREFGPEGIEGYFEYKAMYASAGRAQR